VDALLAQQDWTVLRFWEHEIASDLDWCVDRIVAALSDVIAD